MTLKIHRASTNFIYGITDPKQIEEFLTQEKRIGVSFIGRSNVGKSSSINTLFGRGTAQTSKTPGRTRQINVFEFTLESEGREIQNKEKFYLFDLPGYGHASVSREMQAEWQKLMDTFFRNAGNNILMLNLKDARHPNQKSDLMFKDYLNNFHFDVYLVFNKLDKLKKQKERAALEKLKPQIYKDYKHAKQIYYISAESGKGIDQLERSVVDTLLFYEEIANKEQDL